MPDRAEVLRFAEAHGAKQAADRYGLSAGTIRSWRSRARKRTARNLAAVGVDPATPAGRFDQAARQIVEWATRGTCLTCGGYGYIAVNSHDRKARHPAVAAFQYARRVMCPDCGGPRRRTVIVGAEASVVARAGAADLAALRELEHRDKGHPEAWRE